uniref:XK-related protein n=1 Tax=Electrophorus electricus TaxID=8005 RepID=A0A4W4HP25_ELEEL
GTGMTFSLSSDIVFSFLGFVVFLLDIALDVWAVVSLYQEGSYISMSLLIFLLLGSSALLQVFSWIWYSDPSVTLETSIEKSVRRHGLLGLLHVFQLGVLLRFISICKLKQIDSFRRGVAGFLIYDLNMLRLMETFSESVPQLVLMIHTLIQEQDLRLVSVAKIVGCFLAIAWNMTFYHRSMRKFIPEASKMGWLSSVVYFLWNLLLIVPRVVSLALFASALPCYVAVHFLCLWILLTLWAWWQNTDFMDSKGGEWLYRATVGLIWYFSWFNVAQGGTKLRSGVYHLFMGLDMTLLLVLWWCMQCVESARQNPPPLSPYVLLGAVPALYIVGILLKLVYYSKCHPKQASVEIRKAESPRAMSESLVMQHGVIHKRMRDMAIHFYH